MSSEIIIATLLWFSPPRITRMRLGDVEITIHHQREQLYGGKTGRLPLPGVSLIKHFEGFYAKAYPDPLSGGIPITIGWGSTSNRDGNPWHLGDRITKEQADELLIYQLERDYLPELEKIPAWGEMNARQQGALLSFAYNLGAKFYGNGKFMAISRVLLYRDWIHIRNALILYRNPGSSVERGLMVRRSTEAYVFNFLED